MATAQMAHNLQETKSYPIVRLTPSSLLPSPTHRDGHEDTQSKGQCLERIILGLCAGTAGKEIQYEIPNEFPDQRLPQTQILRLELIEAQRVLEFSHLL